MTHETTGMWRSTRSMCAVACAAAVLCLVTLAAAARAVEAPRWVLTAVPTPTNVMANTPRNEVQEVSVKATAGTFALEVLGGSDQTEFRRTVPISYDASPAEVREAIGKVKEISESEVSVRTGAGGPGTYEVSFEGLKEGATAIEPMRVDSSGLHGGTASVAELVKGANAPQLTVTATNVGGAATDGTTVELGDVLPSWLKATSVLGYAVYQSRYVNPTLKTLGSAMTCSTAPAVSCTYSTHAIDPGDQLVMIVTLAAGAAPSGEAVNLAEVSGGGAAQVKLEAPLGAGSVPAGYGFAPGSVFAAVSNSQAGAHPNVTTAFALNTSETDKVAADPKDIGFDLPPGLVGSTVGLPRCTMQRVISGVKEINVCPNDTMVGISTVTLVAGTESHPERSTFTAPIYNIAPSPGEPAAFGFDAIFLPVRLDTSVLSNGNYAVRVTAPDLPESLSVVSSSITIWGVPAEHSGAGSNGEVLYSSPFTFGGASAGQSPVPLLTSPQQCAEPMVAVASSDSWSESGAFRSQEAPMGTLTGCEVVPFSSSFSFLPDTLEAGTPAGYTFDLNIPQQNEQNVLATSSLKDLSLRLPEGVVVNPSAAWGLKACSTAQFYGPSYPSQEPASPEECPREAQVGEVEVETPDLEKPLKGQVLLGEPECDPCTSRDAEEGKMVRLFVQLVGEGEAGVVVKLEGHARIDQQTGQITTVFEDTPQVPFNRMHFVLEGGPRAVLANPRKCGTVKTTGDLTPWNSMVGAQEAGVISDSLPFYEFEIRQNCFGPQFAPTLKAGMPNIQAGAHGEFTLAFGREDHDQYLKQISLKMPPGLLGTLAGVELCNQAQANAGTCGANSLIGESEVLTGPGADPFLVEGGKVYLTEGYGGSQYGLSIVVPAVAGPYTLSGLNGEGGEADDGKVVVRTQLYIDPHTAQITAVSGTLPSMLDGIPLQLRAVNVKLNRPGFMFNPTSCEKMAITGTVASWEGMSANVSSPFQVTNCARLGFDPTFTASTSAHTSKKDGASLRVKIAYPRGAQGQEANLRYVKVELPEALPSELETLKKACLAQQFAANPAGCPAASVVGNAVVRTPVVPVPLTGPAYFVSHGGAQWPELVMVLQGYGVSVQLNGTTFINGHVTSSTFSATPDVPFESFELNLPSGPDSALAANGNFCYQETTKKQRMRVRRHGHVAYVVKKVHERVRRQLIMPTSMIGQNGATIYQQTPVQVEGCAKPVKKRKSGKAGGKASSAPHGRSAGRASAHGARK